MSGITQFNLSDKNSSTRCLTGDLPSKWEWSADLFVSKIYHDEPQFKEYIKADAAGRAKLRSTKYLELPFFSTKFIRRFIFHYFREQIGSGFDLSKSAKRFYLKFEEVFGNENELGDIPYAVYYQIKRRIGEVGRICWYSEFFAKFNMYFFDPRRRDGYFIESDDKIINEIYSNYANAKAINDIFFSSKLKEDLPDFNSRKQNIYYSKYSYFKGAGLPLYDCYDDILENRKVEWYTKEIYGNEIDKDGSPIYYEYINAVADKRKQLRSLPFFQTKFIRKFIQLFSTDFWMSIKNGTNKLEYAYDGSYQLFKDFYRLFIDVFGSSDDFDDTTTYLQVRKRIGTEARDYWYEEVEAIIPGLRPRLSYSIPSDPKKINDTYFDNKPFENAHNRDQEVLTRRLNDWSNITQCN